MPASEGPMDGQLDSDDTPKTSRQIRSGVEQEPINKEKLFCDIERV